MSTCNDPAVDPYAAKANVAPYAVVVYPLVFCTTKLNWPVPFENEICCNGVGELPPKLLMYDAPDVVVHAIWLVGCSIHGVEMAAMVVSKACSLTEVGPVGPPLPVGPVRPVGPVYPVTVEGAPVGPMPPVGPVTVEFAPGVPVAPVGPVTVEFRPGVPVAPVDPVTVEFAPGTPVAPVGPATVDAAPVSPC